MLDFLMIIGGLVLIFIGSKISEFYLVIIFWLKRRGVGRSVFKEWREFYPFEDANYHYFLNKFMKSPNRNKSIFLVTVGILLISFGTHIV